MALSTRFSIVARNKKIDAITPDLNNGYLRIYDGTRPADPDTAITSQVLLAELRFNATAYGAAANGVAAANAFTTPVPTTGPGPGGATLPWNTAPVVGTGFNSQSALTLDFFFTQTVATGSMIVHQFCIEQLTP